MQTRELLTKVRKIEIRTRRLVEELTGGAWHSVYKGRGIEFSEVREYTPDDDVRDIDWNVTARMGVPYIKKYAEERELSVILAVDASASLFFGKPGSTKRDEAAGIAALLALSAIRNNDKVGLLVFTDKTELWLPPKSGRSHVLRLIRELLAFLKEAGIPCAITSSSSLEVIRRHLTSLGLIDGFTALCSGKDVPRGKPAPDIYLQGAAAIGVPAGECLAVEDSPAGIESAWRAGCKAIIVPDQDQPDELTLSRCFAKADSLTDVMELLRSQL